MMIEKIQAAASASLKGFDAVSDTEKTGNSLFGAAVNVAATAVAGPSFASVMGSMATDALNSVKGGEAASFAAMQGKATTREVVDSVMAAEQSLKTAVAFRDKLVSAYLDITKMQI
jgi:flagellar hook-basal body complex protein FliE